MDLPLSDRIAQIAGVPEVDAAVDSVGLEARGQGRDARREATRRSVLVLPERVGGSPATRTRLQCRGSLRPDHYILRLQAGVYHQRETAHHHLFPGLIGWESHTMLVEIRGGSSQA